MEIVILSVGVFAIGVALLAVLGFVAGKKWAYPVAKTALETYWSARWDEIDKRIEACEEELDRLPRVWEEFARDAKRSQERARWHVRRVKKELENLGLADGEIDTIDSNLRPLDADGSGEEGVLPLRDAVAKAPQKETDPITLALRRKWGNV